MTADPIVYPPQPPVREKTPEDLTEERERQRLITAQHEAGHAVVAYRLGVHVDTVSVIEEPHKDRLGYMHATETLRERMAPWCGYQDPANYQASLGGFLDPDSSLTSRRR